MVAFQFDKVPGKPHNAKLDCEFAATESVEKSSSYKSVREVAPGVITRRISLLGLLTALLALLAAIALAYYKLVLAKAGKGK